MPAQRRATSVAAAAGESASSTSRTNAEPTITPSAYRATSAACSGVETPRPTHTGWEVTLRVRETRFSASTQTLVRAPVTPIVEAA